MSSKPYIRHWLTPDSCVVPVAFRESSMPEFDKAIQKKIAAGWVPLQVCPTKECEGIPDGCEHMKSMIDLRRAETARKEATRNEAALERTKETNRRTEVALKSLTETLRVQHETAEQIATWPGMRGRTRNQRAVARRLAAAIREGRWRK